MNPVASPFDAVRDAPREWIPTLLYKKIFTIALRALSLIALLQSSFITAALLTLYTVSPQFRRSKKAQVYADTLLVNTPYFFEPTNLFLKLTQKGVPASKTPCPPPILEALNAIPPKERDTVALALSLLMPASVDASTNVSLLTYALALPIETLLPFCKIANLCRDEQNEALPTLTTIFHLPEKKRDAFCFLTAPLLKRAACNKTAILESLLAISEEQRSSICNLASPLLSTLRDGKKIESILRLLFNTPTDEQANIVALLQPLLKGISDSHCYVTDFEFSLLLQAFQRIPAANRDSFLKSMSFFLDRDLFWFPLLATNLFDDSAGDLSALHKAIEPILEDVVPLKRDAVLALIVSVKGDRILFCKMVRPFLKDVCTNAQLDILRALQPLTPAERTRIAQLVIPLNLHPIERSLITILFSCAFPNPLADLADIEQDPRPFLIAFVHRVLPFFATFLTKNLYATNFPLLLLNCPTIEVLPDDHPVKLGLIELLALDDNPTKSTHPLTVRNRIEQAQPALKILAPFVITVEGATTFLIKEGLHTYLKDLFITADQLPEITVSLPPIVKSLREQGLSREQLNHIHVHHPDGLARAEALARSPIFLQLLTITPGRHPSPDQIRFYKIMAHLQTLPTTRAPEKLFSPQEDFVITFLARCAACPIGQYDAIRLAYQDLPKPSLDWHDEVGVALKSVVSGALEAVLLLETSPFMKAITKAPSLIVQFSHQVQYVINLLANRYQIPYKQTFDLHTKHLYAPLLKKSLKVLTHPFVSYLIKRLFDRIKRTFIATVAAQFFGKAAEKASPFMMARTQEPSPIAQFSHQVQYVINLLANRYQLPYEQTFDIHTKCLYAPLLEKSPEKLAHAFEAFLIEELLSRTENTFMDNVAAQFFGKAAKEASPLTIYNLLNTSLFAGADLERCWDTSDPEHPKLTRAGALHILISKGILAGVAAPAAAAASSE